MGLPGKISRFFQKLLSHRIVNTEKTLKNFEQDLQRIQLHVDEHIKGILDKTNKSIAVVLKL